MTTEAAVELLTRAETLHLAGTDASGAPVLRTLHGVVDDGWICFHGSPKGEKTESVGRPVVLQVEEVVARIPSYFLDPERACPATTLFRSAQVHGVLEAIEEPVRKARVLDALMRKLQPEGGYVPIDAGLPMYRSAVKGLLIVGVRLDDVTGKAKLAQNRSPEQRRELLVRLWERGLPGDPRTIELIRAANPETPAPSFLQAPSGITLHAVMDERDVTGAVDLIAGEYWNKDLPRGDLERAHLGSTAWVGAKDEGGRVVGTARAITDLSKNGWVYDVGVHPDSRGRGVGKAIVGLLMAHPALRTTRRVWLGTRDMMRLYAKFGFVESASLPPKPYVSTVMARLLP